MIKLQAEERLFFCYLNTSNVTAEYTAFLCEDFMFLGFVALTPTLPL